MRFSPIKITDNERMFFFSVRVLKIEFNSVNKYKLNCPFDQLSPCKDPPFWDPTEWLCRSI